MIRILVTACLSLLLVGMQQQLVVHEIDHLRAKVERGHGDVLQNAGNGACVECSLLAAGSNLVPSSDAGSALFAQTVSVIASSFKSAPARASPAYYHSRAPPLFA